jgi:hypothetical protein
LREFPSQDNNENTVYDMNEARDFANLQCIL